MIATNNQTPSAMRNSARVHVVFAHKTESHHRTGPGGLYSPILNISPARRKFNHAVTDSPELPRFGPLLVDLEGTRRGPAHDLAVPGCLGHAALNFGESLQLLAAVITVQSPATWLR